MESRRKLTGQSVQKRSEKLALVLFKDHLAVGAASQAEYTFAKTEARGQRYPDTFFVHLVMVVVRS